MQPLLGLMPRGVAGRCALLYPAAHLRRAPCEKGGLAAAAAACYAYRIVGGVVCVRVRVSHGQNAAQIIPVRCFTCGKVIGNKWEQYVAFLESENEAACVARGLLSPSPPPSPPLSLSLSFSLSLPLSLSFSLSPCVADPWWAAWRWTRSG